MTTPNTPAGWYSDPDGSGAQRYWDGVQWTEHRRPAAAAPPPPGAGKHAAPPTEPVAPATDTDAVAGPQSPPSLHAVPPLDAPPWYSVPPQDPPSFGAPDYDAPAFTPTLQAPPFAAPPAKAPKDARSTLIMRYGIGVAVGVAAVLATVLYAVFNGNGNSTSTVALSTPTPTTTSVAPSTTTVPSTESSAPSETPIPTGGPGNAANANMTFLVTALDSATTVTSPTDESQTKNAQGQFIIVSMDVTNTGTEPAEYTAGLQKLIVGGTPYAADPQASSYLGNVDQALAPGDQVHTVVVFDVPSGTVPDAIELHGDGTGPGFTLPLQ
jgi:Domain of unknown function (DUF4352)/Protein of unknown function (DUF2510)